MYLLDVKRFAESLKELIPDAPMTAGDIMDAVVTHGIGEFLRTTDNNEVRELAELAGLLEVV